MAYTVTAPLVVVKKQDGRYVHVEEGGLLPPDADADHVAQLVESKMVAEVDDPGPSEPDGSEKPAGNASHDAWVAYAVAQGMAQDDAEALSRDELRDRYAD